MTFAVQVFPLNEYPLLQAEQLLDDELQAEHPTLQELHVVPFKYIPVEHEVWVQ